MCTCDRTVELVRLIMASQTDEMYIVTVLSLPLEFVRCRIPCVKSVRCRISFQSNCRAGTLYRGESNSRALVVELYFVDRTVELVCCTMASQTVELYVVYVICSVTLSCILIELSNLCYIYVSHFICEIYIVSVVSDTLFFEYLLQSLQCNMCGIHCV